MPRKAPSPADISLIEFARAQGVSVSATQLERLRAQGLIKPNVQQHLGRGRGSASVSGPGVGDLVVFLASRAAKGKRPGDAALMAFDAGLDVPEDAVRKAFCDVARRVVLKSEQEPRPSDVDLTDWAWQVAERELASAPGAVLIPRRMRKLDKRLVEAGVNFGDETMAKLDKGGSELEPMSGRDLSAFGVVAMLAGGSEATAPTMAQLLRALAPAGAANPVASMMEYPEGDPRQPSEIHDGAGRYLFPPRDMRDQLIQAISQATIGDLRQAWQAAKDQRRWALALLDAVEAELDAGNLGLATFEWTFGSMLGLHRLVVWDVLRNRRNTPSANASAAVNLLWMSRTLRTLRELVPDGQFHLLPLIVPGFLHPLAGIGPIPADTLLERLTRFQGDT